MPFFASYRSGEMKIKHHCEQIFLFPIYYGTIVIWMLGHITDINRVYLIAVGLFSVNFHKQDYRSPKNYAFPVFTWWLLLHKGYQVLYSHTRLTLNQKPNPADLYNIFAWESFSWLHLIFRYLSRFKRKYFTEDFYLISTPKHNYHFFYL